MRELFLFIPIVFVSIAQLSGQIQTKSKRIIIDSILADTVGLQDLVLKNEMVELANLIQKEKGIEEELFPYSTFDSVVVYRFNKETPLFLEYRSEKERKELAPIRIYRKGVLRKDLLFEDGRKLNEQQVRCLIGFINDYRNFSWGYLSSPDFTKGIIAFYRHNKIMSHIHISSQNVMTCVPRNDRTKHGILSNDTDKFKSLLIDIGM